VTFYFDWTLGWERTKHWTALAVVAYFLLNGAFTWWIWQVEQGTVFEGAGKDGGKVRPKSTNTFTSLPRHCTARSGILAASYSQSQSHYPLANKPPSKQAS